MYVRVVGSTGTDLLEDGEPGSPDDEGHPVGLATGLRERARSGRALFDRPLASYYLIVGITALLIMLGLVMVLSTGSVMNLSQGLSPYSDFEHQLLGVLIGVPLMWVAARSSPRLFRAAAYPLLAVSIIGLGLTLIHGVGVSQNTGAARWIAFGSYQFQPSEVAKLALALWGADLLARKEKLGMLADWRHMLVPLLPGTAVLALLVMAGDDLGTTFILLVIFLALLWIAGTPGRVFGAMLILMGLVLLLLIVTSRYRLDRFESFFSSQNTDPTGTNMQAIQGQYALGSGGLFGVGIGGSKEKWGWVSESTSDFIFAIIGEELGLVGTLCVTALYGGLAFAGLRVARRASDTFSRLAAAAITAWIVTQAVVNIGAVIGVVPITGVPLPLVSYGLSSVLMTMVALGMLMSFARREPGAREALAARGPGEGPRVLSWVGLGTRHADGP
jgi:cell division protein FtsW